MRFVDSSRYSCRFKCPRQYYWAYERDGRGITPKIISEDLTFGLAIHAFAENELLGKDGWPAFLKELEPIKSLDRVTIDGLNIYDEWEALGYGLCRAFKDYAMPKILNEYEVHGVEQEFVLPLGEIQYRYYPYSKEDVSWMTRLDVKLRRREDGMWFNLNYKTSSYVNDLNYSLEHDPQVIMESEALRQHIQSLSSEYYCGGTIVIAFDKGQKRGPSDVEERQGKTGKRRISPFTYGYRKGADPWDTNAAYSVKYKNSWNKCAIWVDPGKERWYDSILDSETKRNAISFLTPIYHDPDFTERVKKQILSSEEDYANRLDGFRRGTVDLDWAFPMNLRNCNQDGGFIHHICPYKDNVEGCFSSFTVEENYEKRKYNHPVENIDEL
jgi:hypothetical protein